MINTGGSNLAFRTATAAALVLIVFWVLRTAGPPARAQSEVASFAAVQQQLADGPIQVSAVSASTSSPGAKVSEQIADATARNAIGIGASPAGAWSVSVVDTEYMGGLLTNRPCWLLQYSQAIELPRASGEPPAQVTAYAVVDASSGALKEVFTLPQAPWWRRVHGSNLKYAATLKSVGLRAESELEPSRVSLRQLLSTMTTGMGVTAQQIVARYVSFSNLSTGRPVHRDGRLYVVPTVLHQPAWIVSYQGTHTIGAMSIPPGPSGSMPAPVPVQEEENVVMSAVTGKLLWEFEIR